MSRAVLPLLDECSDSQQNTLFWNLFFKVKLYHWQRLAAVETTIMRILLPLCKFITAVYFSHLPVEAFTSDVVPLVIYSCVPFLIRTTLSCVLYINIKKFRVGATNNDYKIERQRRYSLKIIRILLSVLQCFPWLHVAYGIWFEKNWWAFCASCYSWCPQQTFFFSLTDMHRETSITHVDRQESCSGLNHLVAAWAAQLAALC